MFASVGEESSVSKTLPKSPGTGSSERSSRPSSVRFEGSFTGLSYAGASSDTRLSGMSATVSPFSAMTMLWLSVTSPMTLKSSPHFLNIFSATSSLPFSSTISIRS